MRRGPCGQRRGHGSHHRTVTTFFSGKWNLYPSRTSWWDRAIRLMPFTWQNWRCAANAPVACVCHATVFIGHAHVYTTTHLGGDFHTKVVADATGIERPRDNILWIRPQQVRKGTSRRNLADAVDFGDLRATGMPAGGEARPLWLCVAPVRAVEQGHRTWSIVGTSGDRPPCRHSTLLSTSCTATGSETHGHALMMW